MKDLHESVSVGLILLFLAQQSIEELALLSRRLKCASFDEQQEHYLQVCDVRALVTELEW
jgi:hypothetical protein